MMKTIADQFANILAAAGVKRIYGIVGDSLNGLTNAIRQGKIQWVHVRHEEVELAVCAGSCGPGNLHLIKGLFDCPQANIRETEVTTATRIAEFMFDKGLAQAKRPQDIRTWIEGQLYKPQY